MGFGDRATAVANVAFVPKSAFSKSALVFMLSSLADVAALYEVFKLCSSVAGLSRYMDEIFCKVINCWNKL